jgi:Na+/citrate or Na+/malate symporter
MKEGLNMSENISAKKSTRIGGLPVPVFIVVVLACFAAMLLGIVEDKLMGGFAVTLTLGVGLTWVGNNTPVLKNYGFGSILAILLPATLMYVGIIPADIGKLVKNFFSGYDFVSFVVPGLLIGSVLAMDRKTLINAGIRFIVPMLGSLVITTLVMGAFGVLIGYGFTETMLFITGPVLGAGVGASAVPLAGIYAGITGQKPEFYLTTLTSSVMIANILTILTAAVLGSVGGRKPNFIVKGFSGTKEGDILRPMKGETRFTEEQLNEVVADSNTTTFTRLGTGFLMSCGIYAAALMVKMVFPTFHHYVYMVVIAIILKLAKALPKDVEDATGDWSLFFGKIMVPTLLVSISLGVLNIGQLLGLLTDWKFLLLNVLTVLTVLVVSGTLSYLFGFYLVEGSIMSGLGLADMGGTGDVAVLTAANKMYLLPFLTVSTRIGGSINLVWCTLLAGMLLK